MRYPCNVKYTYICCYVTCNFIITELEKEAGVGSLRPGEDLVSTSKMLQTLMTDLSKVSKLSHLLSDPNEIEEKEKVSEGVPAPE